MGKRKLGQRSGANVAVEPGEDENMDNYDVSESEDEFGKEEKILLANKRGTKQQVLESEEVVIEPDLVGAQCASEDADLGDEIFPRKWPRALQLSLIDSVRTHYNKFDSINYTHKAVWDIIAKEIGVPSNHKLLSMKWRNLKRTYRHIRDNSIKKPGTIRWEYYQLLDEILANRPDVVPLHRFERPAEVPSTSSNGTAVRQDTVSINGSHQSRIGCNQIKTEYHNSVPVDMVEENVESPEPSPPVKRKSQITKFLEFKAERDAVLEKSRAMKYEYKRAALEFKKTAHNEKMEALRALTSVLEKIVEKFIK